MKKIFLNLAIGFSSASIIVIVASAFFTGVASPFILLGGSLLGLCGFAFGGVGAAIEKSEENQKQNNNDQIKWEKYSSKNIENSTSPTIQQENLTNKNATKNNEIEK